MTMNFVLLPLLPRLLLLKVCPVGMYISSAKTNRTSSHIALRNFPSSTVLCTGPKPGVSSIFVILTGLLLTSIGKLHTVFFTQAPGWEPALTSPILIPTVFVERMKKLWNTRFFNVSWPRLLVAWVHFNLWQICPLAAVVSVTELLFGFLSERRRVVPPIII